MKVELNSDPKESASEKNIADMDDDMDEPLPVRTCNLDDENCESCQ